MISHRFCIEKRMAFVDIAKSVGKTKQHIQSVWRRAPNRLRRAIEPALYFAYAAWHGIAACSTVVEKIH